MRNQYKPEGKEKYPSNVHPVEDEAIKIVTALAREAMSTKEQELAILVVENIAGIAREKPVILDDDSHEHGGC
ncbi:hypothetical protein H8E06_01005 [bacterium]|nr:hypothetical protein [bacterium]